MKRYIQILLLFFFILNLSACNSEQSNHVNSNNYPLIWYPPITQLPVQHPPPQLETKADLNILLKAKWFDNDMHYGSLDLFNSKTGKKTAHIGSCKDYLYKNIKNSEPENTQLYYIFLKQGLTCKAVYIVTQGQNAQHSYIGKFNLDRTLTNKFPIELSFTISPDERKYVKDNKGKNWTSFDTIKKVTKISEYVTKYNIKDATQTLSVLARGDFNHDRTEDVLLLVENGIDAGSLSPTRLFTLTRDKGAILFRVIKEYKLRSNEELW